MSNTVRIALAATAVAVVALIGYQFLVAPNVAGPGPTDTSQPTSTPAPSAASSPSTDPLDTATWTTYVSERYGFTIAHPADWTERPSTHVWTLEADASWDNTASESFIAPDGSTRVSAWSLPVEPGTSVEAWIQAYCGVNTTPCTGIQDRAVAVYAEPMDRHPGLLVPFTTDVQAFFLNGDRIYVVAIWLTQSHPNVLRYGGGRQLLEAFALTMCLGSPEAPCEPAATTPPPS